MADEPTAQTEDKSRNKRGKNISSRMVNYFLTHPGEVVTVQMLAKSLRVTEKQVRESINATRWTHRENPEHPSRRIQTVVRGSSWRLDDHPGPTESAADPAPAPANSARRSTAAASKRIFGEVGLTSDGEYVIEDEDGTLYRAKKL